MNKSFHRIVWTTFSAIDVTPIVSKNKVEYLTWSRVWRIIMDLYPRSDYSFSDREITSVGDNGPFVSVEVSCTLTIRDNDSDDEAVRTMHLPVMQSFGQFLAIENPTARDISDAKMRCFVKTAAIHGLGLTMWSGDDSLENAEDPNKYTIEHAKLKSDYRMELWKTAIVIKEALALDTEEGRSVALEAWSECTEDDMKNLWLAESKGGYFRQKEKEEIRKLRIVGE